MSDELEHVNETTDPTVSAPEMVLDSTEGAEAPTSEPSDESGEASESSAAPSGRPRDERGRYTKAGEPVEGEVVADESAEPVDAAQPGQAQQSAQPAYRPVALKVDGQMVELPGAGQREDGIIELQPDAFEQVHRWMGKGIVSDRKIAHLQSQLQEIQQQKSLREQEVETIGEMYAQMALLDDEQLIEVLRGFRQELPTLKEKLRADHLQRELERRERASQPDPQVQQQALIESFHVSFNEEWEGVRQQPWAKGLTPEDLTQLRAELEEVADSFLIRADRDDPEREIQRGDYLFNDVKFQQAAMKRAQYLATLRQTQAQVQAARVQNAVKRPVATPQGAPKVATPSQTASVAKKPQSREDWLRVNMGL